MVKKQGKCIQTDDAKTDNYDDDININDLAMVCYNSDMEMSLTDKRIPSTSIAQQQA